MKQSFQYRGYKQGIKTVPEVIEQLQMLQKELDGTDLYQLRHFNKTYLIITKNVFEKFGTGYFSDDVTMERLDVNFANYYFDALKSYMENKKTTRAWDITFDFCKENTSIPLIYLAQGVNAHVINDLGLSLNDVVKNNSFETDFNKINTVITGSLGEIIETVKVPKVYLPFMDTLIRRWRRKAWNNFVNLNEKKLTKETVESRATKQAELLAKIHSEKDFHRLLPVF